jgi:hypothetical protein
VITARVVNLPEAGVDWWYVFCGQVGCPRRLGWLSGEGDHPAEPFGDRTVLVVQSPKWRVADGMLELRGSRSGQTHKAAYGLPCRIRCPDCGTPQLVDGHLLPSP